MIHFQYKPETNLTRKELEYERAINLDIVANSSSQVMRDFAHFNIRHFEQKIKNYKHDQALRKAIRGAVKSELNVVLDKKRWPTHLIKEGKL